MKHFTLFAALAAVLAFFAISRGQSPTTRAAGAAPASHLAFRVTFRELQERETDYSGTVSLSEGRPTELLPWRCFGNATIDGPTSWPLHTRHTNMDNQPDQPRPISTPRQPHT